MKIARGISIAICIGFIVAALFALPSFSSAAPLPAGTKLTISPGVACGTANQSGSCVNIGGQPWVAINSGTDGGIVVGKNQLSGGQEKVDNYRSTNPGEMTAAFELVNFGTFATAPLNNAAVGMAPTDASLNVFDDTSCSGAGCIGKTVLGTLNYAGTGNSSATPFGSYYPCQPGGSNICTPDVLAGNGVMNWVVNPDNTYSLDYTWSGGIGGWTGVNIILHLEGQIIKAGCPVVDGVWRQPSSPIFYIFGENLNHVTELMINGVKITSVQEMDGTVLLALVPTNLTRPWIVKVTNTEGCSGSFPKPCGQ